MTSISLNLAAKARRCATAVLLFAFITVEVASQESPVLVGTVAKIVDGDTIDVQLSSGLIRVRLHGVDTPERGQPWGKGANGALSELIQGKEVDIEPFSQDRYDRMIGIVYRGNLNVNLELVRALSRPGPRGPAVGRPAGA